MNKRSPQISVETPSESVVLLHHPKASAPLLSTPVPPPPELPVAPLPEAGTPPDPGPPLIGAPLWSVDGAPPPMGLWIQSTWSRSAATALRMMLSTWQVRFGALSSQSNTAVLAYCAAIHALMRFVADLFASSSNSERRGFAAANSVVILDASFLSLASDVSVRLRRIRPILGFHEGVFSLRQFFPDSRLVCRRS